MNVLSFIIKASDEFSATMAKAKSAVSNALGGRSSGGGAASSSINAEWSNTDKINSAKLALDKVRGASSGMPGMFNGIGASIAGAFGVGAVASFGRAILDYAGQIKDASNATGIGVEKFQALSISAKMNGVSMERLQGALGRVRAAQENVADTKGVQDTFQKINMSIEDVQNASPEALLLNIAQGIKKTGDASVAFELLGRGASGFLSTLDELAGGWEAMQAKMGSGIISEADIEMIDEMGDSLDKAGIVLKSWGAQAVGATAAFSGLIGAMSTGLSLREAWDQQVKAKSDDKKAAQKKRELEEEGRIASEKSKLEKKNAEELKKLDEEAKPLREQFRKANMSEANYKEDLTGRLEEAAALANEEGLTELERRKRMNEALKLSIELRGLERAEAEKIAAAEKSRIEDDKKTKKERVLAESQYKYHSARDEMTPEAQLAQTEKNISIWQEKRKNAGDEAGKAEASKNLIAQYEDRNKLRKEIKSKADERLAADEALAERDRELRGATMTDAEKIVASQKRVAELTGQMSAEKDPDKIMALKEKIMSEAEKQQGLAKADEGSKAMGIGDVFDKMYKQTDSRDPAQVTMELTKEVRDYLKIIKDKKGGMAP